MAAADGVRVQQAAATRAALVAAARRLFAEQGYHATGTPEIVAAAGVSRGALYHHFDDKEDLFEAVFREVETELEERAGDAVKGLAADPLRQLLEGMQAFLKAIAGDPGLQRILLLDGPAVLGFPKWRKLESETTLGHLIDALQRLVDAGLLTARPLQPLAHLILAALNESSLLIANAEDPEAAREETTVALISLVTGLLHRR